MSSIFKGLNDSTGANMYKLKPTIITEDRTYKLWESAGHKLMEAQLTADQIQQIFKDIETQQTAAGGNRTMIGKGKDAADAVANAWNDLKDKIYNSKPMSNFAATYDKAAEKLKQATGGDQGIMKYIQKYRDFAEKYPKLQSFIYSALIAAAGISGAGVAGAVALGLFKLVDQALQGKDIRSAAWSGIKTGAIAYGASKIGDYLKGGPKGGNTDYGEYPDGTPRMPGDDVATQAQHGDYSMVDKNIPNDGSTVFKGKWNPAGPSDTVGSDSWNAAQAAKSDWSQAAQKSDSAAFAASSNATNPDGTASAAMRRFTDADAAQQAAYSRLPGQSSVTDTASGTLGGVTSDQITSSPIYKQVFADQMKKFGGGPWAAQDAHEVAAAAAQKAMLKGKTNESKELSESQIYLIIGKIVEKQNLQEGILDTIKGAQQKATDWVKTKGHNLTTKVTADKLLQAWKKAGSPTDSEEVAKIIQGVGVSPDTIKQVYTGMKVPYNADNTNTASDTTAASGTPTPDTGATAAGATTSAADGSAPAVDTTGTTPAAAPSAAKQSVATAYTQLKELLAQLDKRSKQRIIAALKKDLQLAEGEADYDHNWDEMVKRVGQLAKEGPRKTVWDPVKRVYKTVPVRQVDTKYKKHDKTTSKDLDDMQVPIADAEQNPLKYHKPLPEKNMGYFDRYDESIDDRAVDHKGRTQQQWIQAVKQRFPDAIIQQSKMIDGPVTARLPDGRTASWTPVESGVAEGSREPKLSDYHQKMVPKNPNKPLPRDPKLSDYDFVLIPKKPNKNQKKGVAEGLPGSLSHSDYTAGARLKPENTNCTTCHGRKVMYKMPSGEMHADNRVGAKKIKCPKCNGTGDRLRMGETLTHRGTFPYDVDHMPGPTLTNVDMATDNVRTKDKDHWDRAVNSINARVFDDMAEFRSDSKGETVVGNSAVFAKWDNATQTGWFNAKGRPLKPWSVKEQSVEEDWQKVNKKDKTDGMSKKAVKAYRRENPGSKLKTAVTTKPSKLKKGSKAAKRRKSFCARMSGMKKAHASAKTKRNPDSPINKALRRWNCESIEQMQELIMIAEQKIMEAKNTKQQAAIAIAKKKAVKESTDICSVCGQTPCNCTHVSSIMKGIIK